jgi:hypothetical protein
MLFIVVYDANVLCPSTLRDLLIRIAQAGLVQAKWTDEVLDETFRNLKANRPDLDPAALDVVSKEVVHAVSRLIGGRASEGGEAADSVVVLEPAVGSGGALVVAGPGGVVGPFGLQCAVERSALPKARTSTSAEPGASGGGSRSANTVFAHRAAGC